MLSTETALDWVRSHPLPDGRIIPVCLWGQRGVGKTAWVGAYAAQRRLGFRSYIPAHDSSGADIVGLARIDESIDRTVYARPMWLPSDNDPVVFQRRGVLFVDELNRAPDSVLAGLMEPLGEGRIEHSGWKLPADWGFVCAANPPEPGYDVRELDDALMNRLLHIPMGFDAVRWAAWADGADVHPDLVGFAAAFHAEVIADAAVELPASLRINATPRTVEYLARLYEPGMDGELLALFARGLLGAQGAAAFLAYVAGGERPVSAQDVLGGEDVAVRLGAQRAAGRDDLLDGSVTLMLAMMVRYAPHEQAVERVAAWLVALGPARAWALARVQALAPHWAEPLHEHWARTGA